jgi:hypothetical protein
MFNQPPQPNLTPTHLYNPTKEDFTTTFADENNNPVEYTLHAGEIETFPKYLADHIAKKLAKKIVNGRGVRATLSADVKETLEMIYVNL